MTMTLSDFKSLPMTKTCGFCGAVLPEELDGYDHPDGYPVEGFDKPQWLYKTCRGCKYDWALWKLGVSHYYKEDKEHAKEKNHRERR